MVLLLLINETLQIELYSSQKTLTSTSSAIAAANHRPTGHILEPHVLSDLLPLVKLLRLHISLHGQVVLRRTQVLSKRDDIHAAHTHVSQTLDDLQSTSPRKTTSSLVSPSPSISDVFVSSIGLNAFASSNTISDWR